MQFESPSFFFFILTLSPVHGENTITQYLKTNVRLKQHTVRGGIFVDAQGRSGDNVTDSAVDSRRQWFKIHRYVTVFTRSPKGLSTRSSVQLTQSLKPLNDGL